MSYFNVQEPIQEDVPSSSSSVAMKTEEGGDQNTADISKNGSVRPSLISLK
jgi:hypothetical protein